MEILFNLDKFVFDMIQGSGFVILFLLGVLKILAKETAWTGDDKIIQMLLNMTRKIKVPSNKSKESTQ
jgi:hypothetical protein